jgi:RNA polymerase sigma-70 factor (ECF subfamily)
LGCSQGIIRRFPKYSPAKGAIFYSFGVTLLVGANNEVATMAESIDITAFYEKYAPMVVRRCRQMLKCEDDALDAAQDVFVCLIKAKTCLHGQYPSSLLYTIATNTCLNRIRQKKSRSEVSGDVDDITMSVMDSGYDKVEAKLIMDAILATESESTRSICFMYHGDGMTLKEIGDAVGLSISGVRKRLRAFASRARITLCPEEE